MSDIIVTARRVEERLQDVPLSVNAVTSQALTKFNIREFKDIQSLVPGLALVPDPTGIAPVATLRGVNYDVNNSGSNGTVQFYLNDAPISAGFLLQSMFDVGQVEVLRGPQGTLRGIAAPSGSITVTTHTPDLHTIGGYVDGTVSTIGGRNVNGAVNVPIIPGKLSVRLAGLYNETEANRVHSLNNPSIKPFSDTSAERVTVRFDPIDSVEIIGSYQHLLQKAKFFDQVESANLVLGTPVVGTLVTPFSHTAVEYPPLTSKQDYNVFNLQAQWKFLGQKLNYVGAQSDFDILAQGGVNDIGDAWNSTFPGDPNADPVKAPNLHNYGQHNRTESFAQAHEIRLSSDERLFGIVDYTVGALYNRLYGKTNLLFATPIFASSPPSPANFFSVSEFPFFLKFKSVEGSEFGNVTLHVTDKTDISGGLRHIHFNSYSNLTGSVDFQANVYSATVRHRFNDDIMVYASTGSSWRLGVDTNGIILAGVGNFAYSDPALAATLGSRPETSTSYEVGFKTDWFKKRLRVNATYYHQDFTNYIFSSAPVLIQADNGATPPVYTPAIPNAGLAVGVPVKVDGVEAEVAFQPWRDFYISGTLSDSFGVIVHGSVPCNGSSPPVPPKQVNFCTVSQRSSPNPLLGASVQSEYSHEFTANYKGFVRGQLTYYGDSENDPANPYDNVPSYALFNLFIGLLDPRGGWEITAYGKNIFDQQEVLSRTNFPELTSFATFTGGGAITTNYRKITMTAPQEFGLNLRYAFGSR